MTADMPSNDRGLLRALAAVDSTTEWLAALAVGDSVDMRLVVALHALKGLTRAAELAQACVSLQDLLYASPTASGEAVALAHWLAGHRLHIQSDVKTTFEELAALRTAALLGSSEPTP